MCKSEVQEGVRPDTRPSTDTLPACREAGVKPPDVAKPSPGKRQAAAKKHPHPPEKKAKDKPLVTGIVVSDDPDRKKEDSPCYTCGREGCGHRSVRVTQCEHYKLPAAEPLATNIGDGLIEITKPGVIEVKELAKVLRRLPAGATQAVLTAGLYGYLVGKGLAA